jgi:polyphenol oxidase
LNFGFMTVSGTDNASPEASLGRLRPEWPAPARVQAGVTTRNLPGRSQPPYGRGNLGSHCGESLRIVADNRDLLSREFQLPSAPHWLRQVHGTDVVRLPDRSAAEHDADGAYTSDTDVVCAVLTADCLPILICSKDGDEVAVLHAGWRGLAGGVIESGIGRFAAPTNRLLAWLGPAIGPLSYEVGDDLRDAFIRHDKKAVIAFTAIRPKHWLCDLYTLARQRLAALGVLDVYGGGLDTFRDARFYSHRREQPTGRFASLIWIQS